jgi:hypothetical protein
MVKKSGSGVNIPYHSSEILKTTYFLKFFDVDQGPGIEKKSAPESGMEKSRIRDLG